MLKSLFMRSLAMLVVVGATGCATYQGLTLLAVEMEVKAPRGAVVHTPVAIQEADGGTRFHGSVCRTSSMPPPTLIRLDRIGFEGQILASASRPLATLGAHRTSCVFFDVPTDWRVGNAEHVHVCALRSDCPCEET